MTNQQQPAQPELPVWVEPAVYVDMIENATLYAAFMVTDEAGQVFLMHSSRPEHGQRWQSPGGNVEKGATPWDTAREEYEQETGLRFTGEQRLLGVHYLKPGPAWPRGKVGLLFDGGTLTADQLAKVRLDPREHDRFELHTLPEWKEILSPALFRRVDSLMRARETGCAVYLCDEDLPDNPEQAAGADGQQPVPDGTVPVDAAEDAAVDRDADAAVDGGRTGQLPGESEPEVGAEVAAYLADYPAPLSAADALILDDQGRVLLVDPVYKDGWDLPGGMTEEGPVAGLERELREELQLDAVEIGRLLVMDTVPDSVYGRTLIAYVYAAHPAAPIDADKLVLQRSELRAAGFFPPKEALALLPERLARRLAAALQARRGSHTAVLADGHRKPLSKRDHYALLPAPMTAATVVVTRTDGRVLVQQPSYKQHAELTGGMVAAHEDPGEGARREQREELGRDADVGRVVAVDTNSAKHAKHGRALATFLYAPDPITDEEADDLVPGEEVAAIEWLTREQARERLPWRLAARMDAALDARAAGTTVHLNAGRPELPAATSGGAEADRLRADLVVRLTEHAGLVDPGLRAAFAAVRREALLPRGYVRRTHVHGTDLRVWQLLDGAHPADRAEWLHTVYEGGSVMLQLPGHDPRTTPRGHLSVGGGFASMTTDTTGIVHLLQPLHLARGQRALEAGVGAGTVAALLCEILGEKQVTGIEADELMAAATRERLATAGYHPHLHTGDALAGRPGEEFDRIVLSFSVRSLPVALLGQLAVGGRMVAGINTGSPSFPAHCYATRDEDGLRVVLRPYGRGGTAPALGQPYTRPPRPGDLSDSTDNADSTDSAEPAGRRVSRIGMPDRQQAAGFWLAAGHLLGIVKGEASDPEQCLLYHPPSASRALLSRTDGRWQLAWWGSHDLWAAAEDLHDRWQRAGSPTEYAVDCTDPHRQRVHAGPAGADISWILPDNPPLPMPSQAASTRER